jgi:putative transposase
MRERGISQRRACTLLQLDRASARYRGHPHKEDAALLERLHQIAQKWPRFGYRRAWALLRRDGQKVNHKRVYRLWKQEGLWVKRRLRKRRKGTGQSVPCKAEYPNHVWTYDFVEDRTLSGTRLKMLTVTDEFTRESLSIEVGTALTWMQVIEVLSGLFTRYGAPQFLRSDNGPEFIANALKAWLASQGTGTLYIEPGSPWQNGFAESFHGKFRDECLNAEVFVSVAEARVRVEAWRRLYNEERPHSSLGYKTPSEFKQDWFAANSRHPEQGQEPGSETKH